MASPAGPYERTSAAAAAVTGNPIPTVNRNLGSGNQAPAG
jgi:hypothetical protein